MVATDKEEGKDLCGFGSVNFNGSEFCCLVWLDLQRFGGGSLHFCGIDFSSSSSESPKTSSTLYCLWMNRTKIVPIKFLISFRLR